MTGVMMAVVVASHLGIAAVELTPLWRQREQRGEAWAVIILLSVGLVLAILTVLGYRPIPAYRLVSAIFKPVGTLLFKAKGG